MASPASKVQSRCQLTITVNGGLADGHFYAGAPIGETALPDHVETLIGGCEIMNV